MQVAEDDRQFLYPTVWKHVTTAKKPSSLEERARTCIVAYKRHTSHFRKPRTRKNRSPTLYPFTFGSSFSMVEVSCVRYALHRNQKKASLKSAMQANFGAKSSVRPQRLAARNLHLDTNTNKTSALFFHLEPWMKIPCIHQHCTNTTCIRRRLRRRAEHRSTTTTRHTRTLNARAGSSEIQGWPLPR